MRHASSPPSGRSSRHDSRTPLLSANDLEPSHTPSPPLICDKKPIAKATQLPQRGNKKSCCTRKMCFEMFCVIYKAMTSGIMTWYILWKKNQNHPHHPMFANYWLYLLAGIGGSSSLFNRMTNVLYFNRVTFFPWNQNKGVLGQQESPSSHSDSESADELPQQCATRCYNTTLTANSYLQAFYNWCLNTVSSWVQILHLINLFYPTKTLYQLPHPFVLTAFGGLFIAWQFKRNRIDKMGWQLNVLKKQFNTFSCPALSLYSLIIACTVVGYALTSFFVSHTTTSSAVDYFFYWKHNTTVPLQTAQNIDLSAGIIAAASGILMTLCNVTIVGRLFQWNKKIKPKINDYITKRPYWFYAALCINLINGVINMMTTYLCARDTFHPHQPNPTNSTLPQTSPPPHCDDSYLHFNCYPTWVNSFSLIVALMQTIPYFLNNLLLNSLPDLYKAIVHWNKNLRNEIEELAPDTKLEDNWAVSFSPHGNTLTSIGQPLPYVLGGSPEQKHDARFFYNARQVINNIATARRNNTPTPPTEQDSNIKNKRNTSSPLSNTDGENKAQTPATPRDLENPQDTSRISPALH